MENKTVEMVVKDLLLADNQKKKEEEDVNDRATLRQIKANNRNRIVRLRKLCQSNYEPKIQECLRVSIVVNKRADNQKKILVPLCIEGHHIHKVMRIYQQ